MADEIVPQSNVTWGPKRVKGAKRPHPRDVVQIADPGVIRSVFKMIATKGSTLSQACSRIGISQAAIGRRLRTDHMLKAEMAFLLMSQAWDRTDAASRNNATALGLFTKFCKDAAAALDPGTFGDKVQVENRTLVIHTNLDSTVCETLDGIVQNTDAPGEA